MSNGADSESLDAMVLSVVDSLLEGFQIIGFDWTYLYVNDTVAAHARSSRSALVGRTMMQCFPGIEETPMFEVLGRCMTERTPQSMENEFKFPDGSPGWFELRFLPVTRGVCVLSIDVTERKRAEAALARTESQLRQAQKMDAVGRLAGGVAHDFNNLLSVVLSYTDILLADAIGNDPLRDDLEQIRMAGLRAADLTRQLLSFSRQQVLQPRIVDLSAAVVGMEKILSRLLGAGTELTLLTAPALRKVKVDPGQIEQILMNLAVNARDAMPRGGKLTIETINADLDERYASEHLDVVPGRYASLIVTDTGSGMDAETQARIFEPFFTTKDKGKGTGLGLSTVFGIVKQSGGHVWVYSELGRGTTFKIYFPQASENGDAIPSLAPAPEPRTGSETILLVEDDDQVRAVAVGILRRAGYVVLVAPAAGEALLVSEQHKSRIDLLLSDVVMPRMDGPQLAARLRTSRPEMKVLFMSGYTDDAMAQHGILDSGAAFLQKPITPAALTTRVRDVLDSARRPTQS